MDNMDTENMDTEKCLQGEKHVHSQTQEQVKSECRHTLLCEGEKVIQRCKSAHRLVW